MTPDMLSGAHFYCHSGLTSSDPRTDFPKTRKNMMIKLLNLSLLTMLKIRSLKTKGPQSQMSSSCSLLLQKTPSSRDAEMKIGGGGVSALEPLEIKSSIHLSGQEDPFIEAFQLS